MKTVLACVLILSLSLVLFGCTKYHAQGAGAGAALGGVAGALLDSKNPWRGGVIGAAIGGVTGAHYGLLCTVVCMSSESTLHDLAVSRAVER